MCEGLPLNGAVRVVTENQFAVAIVDACFQGYHERVVFFEESAICGFEELREREREREREFCMSWFWRESV